MLVVSVRSCVMPIGVEIDVEKEGRKGNKKVCGKEKEYMRRRKRERIRKREAGEEEGRSGVEGGN